MPIYLAEYTGGAEATIRRMIVARTLAQAREIARARAEPGETLDETSLADPEPAATDLRLVASYTTGAAEHHVSLGPVPSEFRDLWLLVTGGINSTSWPPVILRLNDDGNSHYDYSALRTSGVDGTVTMQHKTGQIDVVTGWFTPSLMNNLSVMIMRAGAQREKTISGRCVYGLVDGSPYHCDVYGRWQRTIPVTSVNLRASSFDDFTVGSTFELYGVGT